MIETDGLEILVETRCNLSCRGCSHGSPVSSESPVTAKELSLQLGQLCQSYHAKEIRILGGEPLLNGDLSKIVDVIRECGIGSTIRIITNGRLLNRLSNAVLQAIDKISVSIYSDVDLGAEEVEAAEKRAWANGVEIEWKRFDWFREPYATDPADFDLTKRIFSTCQMAHVWKCHTLHDGHLFRCSQSAFIGGLVGNDVKHKDGLPVMPRLSEKKLIDFLGSDEPLTACANCLGSVGVPIPNVQVQRREWKRFQLGSVEDKVDARHLAFLEANPGVLVKDASYSLTGSVQQEDVGEPTRATEG